MAGEISIFISYSRTDRIFVDRLQADLWARGFDVWVDRSRLEGGQQWNAEIERAIAERRIMVLVLSPEAVTSVPVENEYTFALAQGKLVIPLFLRVCPIPAQLQSLHILIDFANKPYEIGLKGLINAILYPDVSLNADSNELYRRAAEAKRRGDLETAAFLLQHILDRDSSAMGGLVAEDLRQLDEQLYMPRYQRLRQEAEEARLNGEYSREVFALQALLDLGRPDGWAEEYLPTAKENSNMMASYLVVEDLVQEGNFAQAKEELRRLWKKAPFFGDPADIAPALGLKVPITYEQRKEEQLADETKAGREQQAKRDRDEAIARAEQERNGAIGRADEDSQKKTRKIEANWSEAQSLMRGDLSAITAEDLARRLGSLDALPSGSITIERIQDLTQTWRQRQSADNAIATAQTKVYMIGNPSYYNFVLLLFVSLAICLGCATCSAIWGVSTAMEAENMTAAQSIAVTGAEASTADASTIWFLTGVLALVAAFLVFLTIFAARWLSRKQYALFGAQQDADESSKKTQRLYQEWLRDAEPPYQSRLRDAELLHKQRLQQIREQRQRAISEAERHHQQTMTEIAAEHARTLADIEARYPN